MARQGGDAGENSQSGSGVGTGGKGDGNTSGMSGENGGWTGSNKGIGKGKDGWGSKGGDSGHGSTEAAAAGEAAEAAAKGRRDTATNTFGGFVDAATDAAKGLATGLKEGIQAAPGAISDIGKDIGRTVSNAVGMNKGMSTLGEVGWSGSGHQSRQDAGDLGNERGAQKGLNEKGLKTVASLAPGPIGTALGLAAEGISLGLTSDEQRGYDATTSQARGLSTIGGLTSKATGIPGLSTIGHAADFGKMAGFAQSEFGLDTSKSEGRRDTATDAFSGGNSSGSYGQSLAGNSTATAPVSTWQPSSIGFGEYDSHLKGLLS